MDELFDAYWEVMTKEEKGKLISYKQCVDQLIRTDGKLGKAEEIRYFKLLDWACDEKVDTSLIPLKEGGDAEDLRPKRDKAKKREPQTHSESLYETFIS